MNVYILIINPIEQKRRAIKGEVLQVWFALFETRWNLFPFLLYFTKAMLLRAL